MTWFRKHWKETLVIIVVAWVYFAVLQYLIVGGVTAIYEFFKNHINGTWEWPLTKERLWPW